MTVIDLRDAETQLAKLMEKVAAGETLVIAKEGKPVAKLAPYEAPDRSGLFGRMRDKAVVGQDVDVKAIARDEIIAMFEDSE